MQAMLADIFGRLCGHFWVKIMHGILFFGGYDNNDCGSFIIVDVIVFTFFGFWIIM